MTSRTRRANLDQHAISADNAGDLATKWTFQTHGDVSATPAVVGGAVYFPDWGGYINKVNAATGQLIWQRKLSNYNTNWAADLRLADGARHRRQCHVHRRPGRRKQHPGRGSAGSGAWRSTQRPAPCSGPRKSIPTRSRSSPRRRSSGTASSTSGLPRPRRTPRPSSPATCAATSEVRSAPSMPRQGRSLDDLHGPAGQRFQRRCVLGRRGLGHHRGDRSRLEDRLRLDGQQLQRPGLGQGCQDNGGTPSQCLDASDHIDAIVALDITTGQIKWATGVQGFDDWIVSCIPDIPAPTPARPRRPGPTMTSARGRTCSGPR